MIRGLVKWRTARIAKRKEELQQQVAKQTKNIEEQSRQPEMPAGAIAKPATEFGRKQSDQGPTDRHYQS